MGARRTAIETGIYRDQYGLAATVKVGNLQREKRFLPDASIKTIKAWQDETRVALRKIAPTAERGTFAKDAERYLRAVASMPTFKEREKHIALWTAEFGPRARYSIAASEIRAVLERWRLAGLAGSTVNHRRTALQHLWTVLDGRNSPNPVRDVPKHDEPEPEARALTYQQIEAILTAMPDRGQAIKGKDRDDSSKTKARLRVLAYTGIPAAQLRKLRPEHVNLDAGTMQVTARRKGRGAAGRVMPLNGRALAALDTFDVLDCWGSFSSSSMWKSFQRACEKVGIVGARPYDLRHSYGTALYAQSGDPRAVQEALMHTAKMTQRYTQGAVDQRLRLAVRRFDRAVPLPKTAGSFGWQSRQKAKKPA